MNQTAVLIGALLAATGLAAWGYWRANKVGRNAVGSAVGLFAAGLVGGILLGGIVAVILEFAYFRKSPAYLAQSGMYPAMMPGASPYGMAPVPVAGAQQLQGMITGPGASAGHWLQLTTASTVQVQLAWAGAGSAAIDVLDAAGAAVAERVTGTSPLQLTATLPAGNHYLSFTLGTDATGPVSYNAGITTTAASAAA